jgi:hypothetical protein
MAVIGCCRWSAGVRFRLEPFEVQACTEHARAAKTSAMRGFRIKRAFLA